MAGVLKLKTHLLSLGLKVLWLGRTDNRGNGERF